jgi:hypothetical protein
MNVGSVFGGQVISGGTITITYTATQTQLLKVLANAAEHLYPLYRLYDNSDPRRPIPYSSLTNAQKLDILNKFIRGAIVSAAEKNRDAKSILAGQTDDQVIS